MGEDLSMSLTIDGDIGIVDAWTTRVGHIITLDSNTNDMPFTRTNVIRHVNVITSLR